MEIHYCWRCQCDIPMLDEAEWEELAPIFDGFISNIKAYRDEHGVDLAEARQCVSDLACAAYERLTGFHETNPNAIPHHRLALYGPPCGRCGRLLRTPRASFCAACGWRPDGSHGTP